MKTQVLYHANCPDGFCAAWAAYTRLGADAEYIPVQYGQDPPDVAGNRVYILDFSYRRDVLLEMVSRTSNITILDHHKTAAADLEGFADECMRAYGLIPPTVVFDMNKSGGRLAWEHFHPGRDTPWLVEYTEDRDLWRWALPNSRDVNAGLSAQPKDFASWCALDADPDSLERMRFDGRAINRYIDGLVDSICRGARETEIAGHKVLAANTSVLFSEVAGKLAEGRPFGAAWFIRADGMRQWSLRSTRDGVDVSEIAKSFGGGGHRNAAGYQDSPTLGGI